MLKESETKKEIQKHKHISFRTAAKIICKTLNHRTILLTGDKKIIKESRLFKQRRQEYIAKSLKLSPEVEGRSVLIQNEEVYLFE